MTLRLCAPDAACSVDTTPSGPVPSHVVQIDWPETPPPGAYASKFSDTSAPTLVADVAKASKKTTHQRFGESISNSFFSKRDYREHSTLNAGERKRNG
jgi:hypothetical protein